MSLKFFMVLLEFLTPSIEWAHYGLSGATVSSAFGLKPQLPMSPARRF
jgi:hypothetical protein